MLSPGQSCSDTHRATAGASNLDLDHRSSDAQCAHVGVNHLAQGRDAGDTQLNIALGNQLPAANEVTSPEPGPPPIEVHDALLAILASSLDDLERVRIATANRLRALDAQGLADSQFAVRVAHLLEALEAMEHQATLDLQRAVRKHPLGSFIKATVGIGEKQGARLLAAVGDPASRSNPAKLWQYAGHGDPARSRKRRGEKAEFNPVAKMRVHLCAQSCIKHAHSPYRAVYDHERARWAHRDVSDGHKHNHALRVVGKQILLDLWKAATS